MALTSFGLLTCESPTTPVTVSAVAVSPLAASLLPGQTVQLSASPTDGGGVALPGRPVTWSSTDTTVARVASSGLVLAASYVGSAVRTAGIAASAEGKSGVATITVTPLPVALVLVSPANSTALLGQNPQLTATTQDSSGQFLTGRSIAWASLDTTVARVSNSGQLTTVALGGATITATSEGRSGTATLTVVPVPVRSVTVIPASSTVFVGQRVQFAATVRDSAGGALSGRTVTWSTSDSVAFEIASAGQATAIGRAAALVATVTVTATSEGSSGTASVTVRQAPIAGLAITPDSALVMPGNSVLFVGVVRDSSGATIPGLPIAWSSSDTTVARVSSTGLATALAYVGTAIRSALVAATSEGRTATAKLTVTPYLTDPAELERVAEASIRSWFNTYEGMTAVGPLVTQAESYTASWNNFNMNYYSSLDADGTRGTRGWQNDPSAAGISSVKWFWEGYYNSFALATSVLDAIRIGGAVLGTQANTRRAEAFALLVQGASLSGIALNYDRGFTNAAFAVYADRKAMREAALAKLDSAITVATGSAFITLGSWANGPSYSNVQIAQIANTMAANLIANWPRNNTENATADWARVVTYASRGLSSGSRFDYVFTGDGNAWYPEILAWFNVIDTGRLHTRVANLMDPGTQTTPWPLGGNPKPISADRRLGDGSFGTAATAASIGTYVKTTNAGTDFAWSASAIFNMARGSYHQSNIAHIRYDVSGTQDPNGAIGGRGPAPVLSAGQNDLLWAEGLLQSNGSLALAATLINNTRVTRGNLAPATAADGTAVLMQRLRYEMEIELLGLGAAPFYHRRRMGGLIAGTPHEMPVPANVLISRSEPLYSFGGMGAAHSPTPP